MAFTVKGEYERLKKISDKDKSEGKDGIPFECGCACGYVEDIIYVPWHYDDVKRDFVKEHIEILGRAGFDYSEKDSQAHLLLSLYEDVCSLPYYMRWYRYNKKFGIFEYFIKMREEREGFNFKD